MLLTGCRIVYIPVNDKRYRPLLFHLTDYKVSSVVGDVTYLVKVSEK